MGVHNGDQSRNINAAPKSRVDSEADSDNAGGSGQQMETTLRVPMEIYSRVVGYLRPVSAWNAAKKQEFKERKVFKQPEATSDGSHLG